MNQPGARLCASISQSCRMVVIAADNFRSLRHVAARRANCRQIHDNRVFSNTFNDALIGEVCDHELATFVIQSVLDSIKIQINAKNAPLSARQNGVKKVTTNKTTATNNGYGDTLIIELRNHSLTMKKPELLPLFCLLYGATRIAPVIVASTDSASSLTFAV